MRERHLSDLTRVVGSFRRPIAEGRSKAVGCDADLHATKHREHRHIRKGSVVVTGRENVLTLACFTLGLENLKCSRRQGNSVLLLGLHAYGGDGPGRVIKVDLIPTGTARFHRSGRRQDQELQGAGRNAAGGPEALHEDADLAKGQRGLVFDGSNVRPLG